MLQQLQRLKRLKEACGKHLDSVINQNSPPTPSSFFFSICLKPVEQSWLLLSFGLLIKQVWNNTEAAVLCHETSWLSGLVSRQPVTPVLTTKNDNTFWLYILVTCLVSVSVNQQFHLTAKYLWHSSNKWAPRNFQAVSQPPVHDYSVHRQFILVTCWA